MKTCPKCGKEVEKLVRVEKGDQHGLDQKGWMCANCEMKMNRGTGVHKMGSERQETRPYR